jgi:ubiquinol-cytochrome c reductase iron-sulfur subunit
VDRHHEVKIEPGERGITFALLVSTAAALGLAVVYIAGGQAQLEGLLLGLSLGGLGVAVILWSKHFFPHEEVTAERPSLSSEAADREAFIETFQQGEERFTRRRFLSRLLGVATGAFGFALFFPVISLGPRPNRTLFRTGWREGVRMNAGGRTIRVGDLEIGGILTVFPDGRPTTEDSATLLIRTDPAKLRPRPGREDWAPEGYIAFSKICTHVGCPVGLYQESTNQLLCPCHQSTFDVLDGARPIFGPATRSLPQLPLGVDAEGFLIARGDYPEPVGPGFWNRDRR